MGMPPLDQLWTYITDNAAALGVILTALLVIAAFLGWWWPRKTDPPSGGGDTVHGPKVGGNVGGDAVGRDKTTAGRDQQIGDRFQSHNITANAVTIQQSVEAVAHVAVAPARSRFQLPARNPDFEGRREKIEEIRASLRAGAAQVTALEGMGGIGKTDTAIEAAHDLVDEGRFKDARLFLDLQGFSEMGHPLLPAEALRSLLRAFVPGDEVLPESENELAGRFWDATSGLDMLLFLDNARDDAQVEPLLPGHPGCNSLITSRNRLSLRGLKPIDLAEMDPNEAASLALKLANRRDPTRITYRQAEEIARLCGRLPISIEVTANALSKSRGASVTGYLQKLNDRTKPLAALEKAKAVLGLSAEALDADTCERWAALGVFEGGFFDFSAAAVWAVEDAGPTLGELEQRSLVSFDLEVKRYHLHDLLRAVALEELAADPARQHEVRRRHAELFFAALQTADFRYRAGHDGVAQGLAFVDAELGNIRAAQLWAATAIAEDERAALLAQNFPNHDCLRFRLAHNELRAWLEQSLVAAARRGDTEGYAGASANLGQIYRMLGELDRAEEMVNKSLALAEDIGSKEGTALQYANLGYVYAARGEFGRAEEMFKESLTLAEEMGFREHMAQMYGSLGISYAQRGDFHHATNMLEKGLALGKEVGSKHAIADQYVNFGLVHAEKGDPNQAVACWRKALALYRRIGERMRAERVSGWLREAGVDPDQDEAAE